MSVDSTNNFGRPYRPLPVRLFNGVGRLLRRVGLRRPLDAGRILDAARRRTGLADFGELDVREPLGRLVQSLEGENRLTPLGRLLIRRELVPLVVARLRIRAALKQHPEILGEQVARPVFILGLARTGSTLLHRLLAQDPGARALSYGETMEPAPGGGLSSRGRSVWRARLHFAVANRLAPRLRSIHPLDARAPEECRLLLMNTFRTPFFGHYGLVTGYMTWLNGLGLEGRLAAYEAYRRQLQLLQWGCPPRRWVLKAPLHTWGLDAILQLFPDACVVQTHRDLAEVVPSMCSLMMTFRGLYSDDVDLARLSHRLIATMVRRNLGATLQARETHPGRIHDVAYDELMRDPVGTIRGIYQRFGLPWSAPAEAAMRAWLAANPQGKHGRHRYSLEQFGLDRAAVDRLFPGYPECFGLPPFGGGPRRQEPAPASP
jgi:hypothetical protein